MDNKPDPSGFFPKAIPDAIIMITIYRKADLTLILSADTILSSISLVLLSFTHGEAENKSIRNNWIFLL